MRQPGWFVLPLRFLSGAMVPFAVFFFIAQDLRASALGLAIAGSLTCWIVFVFAVHSLEIDHKVTTIMAGLLGGASTILLRVSELSALSSILHHVLFLNMFMFKRPFLVALAVASAAIPIALYDFLSDPSNWSVFVHLLMAMAYGYGGYSLVRDYSSWTRERERYDHARAVAADFAQVNTRVLDTMDIGLWESRREERTRLAREIHDTVGYTLTAVLLQAQAAEDVIQADPGEVVPRIRDLQQMVRDAIQEVRTEVHTLRDKATRNASGRARWVQLCSVFADSSGIDVHVDIDPALESVSEDFSNDVYRIIQEAMINAFRHGEAANIDIAMAIEKDEDRVLLRISDNGVGAERVDPGSGLTGMNERVRARSGSMVWQTQPGRGFDIGIELPWKEGAA